MKKFARAAARGRLEAGGWLLIGETSGPGW
ncbi:hypothetical protein BURPS1710b_1329 [Burkholderia pseudomallei 1710b]|uniref:Uncharacterized protein n=1 Tax=Burkholderia pseudomallei (strain 1710b) TaxID=320372 RepID=Q3JUL4_BURP1|nr:hypothetical protein BURPS1710b_1329 [Burkholderia pseudomallei 1710b]